MTKKDKKNFSSKWVEFVRCRQNPEVGTKISSLLKGFSEIHHFLSYIKFCQQSWIQELSDNHNMIRLEMIFHCNF